MEGIVAKMTNSRRTRIKQQKSANSVACHTLLITGSIKAPIVDSEKKVTPYSVPYSGKSRSVGSKDRRTGD